MFSVAVVCATLVTVRSSVVKFASVSSVVSSSSAVQPLSWYALYSYAMFLVSPVRLAVAPVTAFVEQEAWGALSALYHQFPVWFVIRSVAPVCLMLSAASVAHRRGVHVDAEAHGA